MLFSEKQKKKGARGQWEGGGGGKKCSCGEVTRVTEMNRRLRMRTTIISPTRSHHFAHPSLTFDLLTDCDPAH